MYVCTYAHRASGGSVAQCTFSQMKKVMSHMNKSRHVRMRHVTYECVEWHMSVLCHIYKRVLSHINESKHTWNSDITHVWVMSHMNESWHATYEWVMSHMNESCHTCMSHVTHKQVMLHMIESCHIWKRHVTYERVKTHMKKPCHVCMSHVTYEWIMSRYIWMRHVTYEYVMSHITESCHTWISYVTHEWVTSHRHRADGGGSTHWWRSARAAFRFFPGMSINMMYVYMYIDRSTQRHMHAYKDSSLNTHIGEAARAKRIAFFQICLYMSCIWIWISKHRYSNPV